MRIVINPEISLMKEAVELVFTYVNQMNPGRLAVGDSGIPQEDVCAMMDAACGDLDLKDPILRFFFQSFTIDNYKNTSCADTCVAIIMVYSFLRYSGCDMELTRKSLHDHHIGHAPYIAVTSFNVCGLGTLDCQEYRSLAAQLNAFDMPDGLRLQLLEMITGYHRHVDLLCDLLEPVAQKLLPLLMPWWEKAESSRQQWLALLSKEEGLQELCKGFTFVTDDMEQIEMNPHLLRVGLGYGSYDHDKFALVCDFSFDAFPGKARRNRLSSTEIAALRLLANPDRIEMLQIMMDGFVTPKELTERLNLYSGSVFRDLSNMFQAQLLDVEVDGIHRSYKTNIANLERLVNRLVQCIKNQRW